MNVRIFWVRAMKCMCAQTRPRFILSSEGVFGGMEFEPMLTPREKSPLPENVPRGGSNPRHCGQWAQALPTELFRPPVMHIIYSIHNYHSIIYMYQTYQKHKQGFFFTYIIHEHFQIHYTQNTTILFYTDSILLDFLSVWFVNTWVIGRLMHYNYPVSDIGARIKLLTSGM